MLTFCVEDSIIIMYIYTLIFGGVAMNEDFKWFEDNYSELQSKYGNAFLAIKNKKVIGVYYSYGKGVRETQKNEELGTFIIQECNKNYIAYTCCIASMNFS